MLAMLFNNVRFVDFFGSALNGWTQHVIEIQEVSLKFYCLYALLLHQLSPICRPTPYSTTKQHRPINWHKASHKNRRRSSGRRLYTFCVRIWATCSPNLRAKFKFKALVLHFHWTWPYRWQLLCLLCFVDCGRLKHAPSTAISTTIYSFVCRRCIIWWISLLRSTHGFGYCRYSHKRGLHVIFGRQKPTAMHPLKSSLCCRCIAVFWLIRSSYWIGVAKRMSRWWKKQ